ncbi:MAG TPA: sigma-70 family RNA polymerase sigma factor, partial [Steroidobacteraceae bacterium]|nr:sigma-70 family RNA polymerase sigma factor [Steroidobacteraceae bacterium]
RGRDTRAFETLMRRYNRRLYRIARSILTNAESAEEAVRAAYLRAFANLDRYEPAGKFGAWLARLAFHEALALRRHIHGATPEKTERTAPAASASANAGSSVATASGARPEGYPSDPSGHLPEAQALQGTDAAATQRMLEEAIDALPEVFRTVLVLRVVEELSGVEVAVCLGLNETTVRTRLYRAQQRLKDDVARRLRAEPSNIFELTGERSERIVSQVFARLHTAIPTTDPR